MVLRVLYRTSIAAVALALLLAACTDAGDGNVVDGTTPASPSEATAPAGGTGPTGTTGPTGATSQPVMQGTFETSFHAGPARVTLEGYSCDVQEGSWTATVSMSGGAKGSGSFAFDVPVEEEEFKANWGFDGTWQGAPASFRTKGTAATKSSASTRKLWLFGLLTVTSGSNVIRGPANAVAKVRLGPVPECS